MGAIVGKSGTSDEELWTTGKAADYLHDLGITRRQVWRMVEAGELPAVRRGERKWARIPAARVRAYREALLSQLDTEGRSSDR